MSTRRSETKLRQFNFEPYSNHTNAGPQVNLEANLLNKAIVINVVHDLSRFQENFVIVPADKASNTNYDLFARNTTSTFWSRNLDSIHFLGTLHTFWQIFLHQKCRTTSNRSSLPSEYRQIVRSSICLTFIGFRRCTRIHINLNSLRIHQSVRQNLYQFYSQNYLHIFRAKSRKYHGVY